MTSVQRVNKSALAELFVNKKTFIISLIMLGISGFAYRDTTSGNIDWVSCLFMFFAVITLVVTCSSVFKDMYDIPTADVQMSMPLSAGERFASKLLTICYMWFFPFLVAFLTGSILSCIHDGKYSSSQGGFDVFSLISFDLSVLFVLLAVIMFIISVMVLCNCCMGSKSESIYIPLLFMLVITFLPIVFSEFLEASFWDISSYGYFYQYSDNVRESIYLWGLSILGYEGSNLLLVGSVNIVISIVCLLVGYKAYISRDARSVGTPVVYKLFFEALMFISSMLSFVITYSSATPIVLFIFFVAYIVIRIIVLRGKPSFADICKWILRYVIYFVLFISISLVMCLTLGFGTEKLSLYYPDECDSASITMNVSSAYSDVMEFDAETLLLINDKDKFEKAEDVLNKYLYKQNNIRYFFDTIIYGDTYFTYNTCYVYIYMYDTANERTNSQEICLHLKNQDAQDLANELSQIFGASLKKPV